MLPEHGYTDSFCSESACLPVGPQYVVPSLHRDIQYLIHRDSFDSDHHPICVLSNNMIVPVRPCLTSGLEQVNWSRESVCLNTLVGSSEPTYVAFKQLCKQAVKSHRVVRSSQARRSPPLVVWHLLIFVASEEQVPQVGLLDLFQGTLKEL